MSISIRATAPPPPQSNRIVSDDELEKALDFLRDSAAAIGAARSEMIRSSHMVKVVRALTAKHYSHLPVSRADIEALASDEYMDALNNDAIAAGEFEKLRALREAAAMKIQAWQTESANYRGMRVT